MKPSTRFLQAATLALLALSLGGCIILPHGHRHHGQGRHASERAVVVVPVDRDHDRGHRHGRRHRD